MILDPATGCTMSKHFALGFNKRFIKRSARNVCSHIMLTHRPWVQCPALFGTSGNQAAIREILRHSILALWSNIYPCQNFIHPAQVFKILSFLYYFEYFCKILNKLCTHSVLGHTKIYSSIYIFVCTNILNVFTYTFTCVQRLFVKNFCVLYAAQCSTSSLGNPALCI